MRFVVAFARSTTLHIQLVQNEESCADRWRHYTLNVITQVCETGASARLRSVSVHEMHAEHVFSA